MLGDFQDLKHVMRVEWPRPRPRNEHDICKFLMQSALPLVSSEAHDAVLLKYRHTTPKDTDVNQWTTTIDTNCMGAVIGLVDQHDAEAIKVEADKKTSRRMPKAKSKAKSKAVKKTSSRKCEMPDYNDIDVEQARLYLPDCVGCLLKKDTIENRFIVCYPNETNPFSFSAKWSNDVAQTEALRRLSMVAFIGTCESRLLICIGIITQLARRNLLCATTCHVTGLCTQLHLGH